MKTVIAGQAKTGTSGLFYKIKNSLPSDVTCAFEPPAILLDSVINKSSLLVKTIVDTVSKRNLYKGGHLDRFDRRVFIVRDPRDRLISAMLYGPAYHFIYKDIDKAKHCIGLLEQKEQDPSSISMKELCLALYDGKDFLGLMECGLNDMMDCIGKYDHHCLVKYEDFVEDRLFGVSDYLGVELTGSADVPNQLNRVVRTKGSGSWRNWFVDSDIDFFRPLFHPFMERLGYADNWEMNAEREIQTRHCSEYFEFLCNEKRRIDDLGDVF